MQFDYIKFRVCVTCFTFNQASYIVDAMNGFTMQQTDFPYVCCIVDDASTDGEQDVINDYVNQNFNIEETIFEEYGNLYLARHRENKNCYFVVLLLKENHYSSPELKILKRSYISCWETSSQYIALCEGDDYWVDSLKLQKQVDFLDRNPEYSMCTTNVLELRNNVYNCSKWNSPTDTDLTIEEIIMNGGLFIATCSLLFYSDRFYEMPESTRNLHVGDYPLQIYMAFRGKVRQIADLSCVYRVSSRGSWTRGKDLHKFDYSYIKDVINREIHLLEVMDTVTDNNYHTIFNKRKLLYLFDSYLIFNSKNCIRLFLRSPVLIIKHRSLLAILFSFLPKTLKQMILSKKNNYGRK